MGGLPLSILLIVFGIALFYISVLYPRTILALVMSVGLTIWVHTISDLAMFAGLFLCGMVVYLAYCVDLNALIYADIGFMTTLREMEKKANPEYLGKLAFDFRGTQDEDERDVIADEYASVVEYLIAKGGWEEAPAPEDQLPHDYMPESYFLYWTKKENVSR